jgi:tetratricopeptide (TPR) repeat protein
MAKLGKRRNGRGSETLPERGALGLGRAISLAAPPSAAQAREAFRCAVDGAGLLAEGRPALAISMFERSIKLNPASPAAHNNLGVALVATGRLKQAIEQFSAALRLDPSLASCHFQLAHIFDSLGHTDQAMAAYQAGVALKPDVVAPQLRLGQLYSTRGQRVKSAAAFRTAAAAAAGTILAPIAEAGALHALGALDEALAIMREAVRSFPQSAEAYSNLGQLLGQAGHFSEAAAHHDRATQLSPEMAASWSGLATNKTFTLDDAPLIARMNAALARVSLTPRHRQALHFALGKAQDDIGDYEKAIHNFEAGNRERALSGRFNRRAFAQRIDQLIHETPPGYRDHHPDRGVEDATPILIVGLPRSGSTLIEQILSSHPDIAGSGELEFWPSRASSISDCWSFAASADATRRIADDYLAILRSFGPVAKRVTDKALDNFVRLGFIHRVFPNATLIYCRRNPLDTALSIFTTNFERNYPYASDRGDLVFFIRQCDRLLAHWRVVIPADRLVEVEYEALVADPGSNARRLIAACGLEWNDACLTPHLNKRAVNTASLWQARQPIYRTSVERWRRYEPWLGELRELATGV